MRCCTAVTRATEHGCLRSATVTAPTGPRPLPRRRLRESDGKADPDVPRGAGRREGWRAARRQRRQRADHRRWCAQRLQDRSGSAQGQSLQRRMAARASHQCAAVEAGGIASGRRTEEMARRVTRHDGTVDHQPARRCLCAALEQAAQHENASRTGMLGRSGWPLCPMRRRCATSSSPTTRCANSSPPPTGSIISSGC